MSAKIQAKLAKKMFKKSLKSDGLVDPHKVHLVLNEVNKLVVGQRRVLKTYKRLIWEKLKKEEVIIKTATSVNQKHISRDIVEATGAKRVIFQLDPKMVFGLRIIHGDWIYDATLDAKLDSIQQFNN